MRTVVSELLQKKGRAVATIDAGASIHGAIVRMHLDGVGSLVVLEEGEIVGTFTDRDCARCTVLEGRDPLLTPVRAAMTATVHHVTPGHTVEDCMTRLTETRCRHLLVLDLGRLVGVLSVGDCAAHLVRETAQENTYLRDYIAGPYPPP